MKNCHDEWVAMKTQPDYRIIFASFVLKCHSIIARAKMNLPLRDFDGFRAHKQIPEIHPGRPYWNHPFTRPPNRADSPHVNRP